MINQPAESQLRWNADKGFELDLEGTAPPIGLRLFGIAIPADGTDALAEGVELDKLDILFKAEVDVGGEPGQLLEATVSMDQGTLTLRAKIENAETCEIHDLELKRELLMPAGAPAFGGPTPEPTREEDLDWDDEQTFEHLLAEPPQPADSVLTPFSPEESEVGSNGNEGAEDSAADVGFGALLKAMVATDLAALEAGQIDDPAAPDEPEAPVQLEGEVEAGRFLVLLIQNEELELVENGTADPLLAGTAAILAMEMAADAKATKLSDWLLSQDAVEELYIDDERLAELLDQW